MSGNSVVDIQSRYNVYGGANPVRVGIDLTIPRSSATWQRWRAQNSDYQNALWHKNVGVLDEGAITEALNAQFAERDSTRPFTIEHALDIYFAPNRQIQILQAVEKELFEALVVNAGNKDLGARKLNAYKAWRERGIKDGLIQIIGDDYSVLSQPDTEWLFGGQGAVIPPLPESLPGKLPDDYADDFLFEYSLARESSKNINQSTAFYSTDLNTLFDRSNVNNSTLSQNTFNPVDLLVSSVTTGSISPLQLFEFRKGMNGGGMPTQWQALEKHGFDVYVPLLDADKNEVGYYGINEGADSELYIKNDSITNDILEFFGADTGVKISVQPDQRVGLRTDDNGIFFLEIEDVVDLIPQARALKRVRRFLVEGTTDVLLVDGVEIQVEAYEDPYSLIEELNPDILCFAAGTLVDMSDGSSKPIEQIKIGDEVLAYDASDRKGLGGLSPRRVTRTYATPDKLVIDFHGLKVTPGHVFLCGDGQFAGEHRMLMEILRSDGTIVSADGTVLRAATNAPVGSREDAFLQVAYLTDANDALMQSGRMRAGTLVFTAEGETKSVLECLETEGYRFDTETGLVAKDGEEPHPLYWYGEIPRPEDYVLKRSDLTDADLYAEPGYRPEVATSEAPSRLSQGHTPSEGLLYAEAGKQAGETIH